MRLRIARATSCREFKLFMGEGRHGASPTTINRGIVRYETTNSHSEQLQSEQRTQHCSMDCELKIKCII